MIFRRNIEFHIDHNGTEPVIHCGGNFNRALTLHPNAALLFAAMVKTEAAGHGIINEFEVAAYKPAPMSDGGQWARAWRNKRWAERDQAWRMGR